MGGDHHHHGPPYKIPDYRIFKVDKHSPELVHVQDLLKSVGLKDPWLRNEVWRYNRQMIGEQNWMTTWGRLMFRRFPTGLALGIATALGFKGYDAYLGGGHDDHGSHGGHH